MRAITLLVLAVVLLAGGPAVAADPPSAPPPPPPLYLLDLAGGDTTTPVEARKEFRFQVVDELPPEVQGYSMSLTITEEEVLAFASPFTPSGKPATGAQKAAVTLPPGCATLLSQLVASLKGAANEGAVKAVIATDQTPPGCEPEKVIDALTKSPEQKLTLKTGQVATLVVTRGPLKGEKDSKTWTFKFTAGTKGAWLMHYGFSFFGNRDEAFFAAAATQNGQTQYTITPKAKRNNIQYLPTFTFSYLPAYFQSRGWGFAPTAGVGTDLSNVTAFVGGSLIIRQNVNVYLGIAGAKQQRLNGKYHAGDTVKDPLSEDQLNEKVYVPTVVFGVGFRFSSNPFNSGSGAQTTTTKPPAQATTGGGAGGS
jgi:hypothetical protein